jgi:hypothetical protein
MTGLANNSWVGRMTGLANNSWVGRMTGLANNSCDGVTVRRMTDEGPQPTMVGKAAFWQFENVPDLTIDQYRAIIEVFRNWCLLKAEHEPRWTDEQRACLRQLDPDVWHSSLLFRMLKQRKLPLPEPPRLQNSYPVYPDES